MEWPPCLNGTAVRLSVQAQAAALPPEAGLGAVWLALTCSWLALLLWGSAATAVVQQLRSAVAPHATAAWGWAWPRLRWTAGWVGLGLRHVADLAIRYSCQVATFLQTQIGRCYDDVTEYLASVDPIVYRQLAVAALWLIGLVGAYKWMERRGYFTAAQRRYRRVADRWVARYQRCAAGVAGAVAAGRRRWQAGAAATAAVYQKTRVVAGFAAALPGRGLRAARDKARAVRAAVAAAWWSVVAAVRFLLGAPGRAWRAVAAAARRARQAALHSLQQGREACVAVAAAGRGQVTRGTQCVCSLPRRSISAVGRQRDLVLQRCRQAASATWGWLWDRWEAAQPTIAHHWQRMRPAQPHVLYWALVGTTMQLLPGSALAAVDVLFHGPWVVDFLYPAGQSLYALQQDGAGTALDFRVCLQYWVVFFNLHLLYSLLPEAVLSTVTFSEEFRLFFSLWLQLPFTNGVAPLFTAVSWIIGSYNRSVQQPVWVTTAPDSISGPMKVLRYVAGGWVSTAAEVVLHSWHLVWYCVFFFTPGFVTAYGCLFAGIVLPTKTTLSAMAPLSEAPEAEAERQRGRQRHWLGYWLTFALVHVVFHRVLIPLFGFLPLLRHLQLCLIIALQLPNQVGAKLVPVVLWFVGKQAVQTGRYAYRRLSTPRGPPPAARPSPAAGEEESDTSGGATTPTASLERPDNDSDSTPPSSSAQSRDASDVGVTDSPASTVGGG